MAPTTKKEYKGCQIKLGFRSFTNLSKGGIKLFCPKCRSEFREGFSHCRKCDQKLVKKLPPEVVQPKRSIPKLLEWQVEKWLKLGGLVLIPTSILYYFVSLFDKVQLRFGFDISDYTFWQIVFIIIGFLYDILNNILWGLFFFGFGKIIEVLKRGFNYEQE